MYIYGQHIKSNLYLIISNKLFTISILDRILYLALIQKVH